jgi:hypothetical protein
MKTKRFSRALAMALVLIMVLGTLPLAAFATETAEVAQWNVTLRDDLGVNFYLSIPDSAVANAQIKLTVGNGEPITYNAADMTVNGDGYYAVSTYFVGEHSVRPFQMQLTIVGATIGRPP